MLWISETGWSALDACRVEGCKGGAGKDGIAKPVSIYLGYMEIKNNNNNNYCNLQSYFEFMVFILLPASLLWKMNLKHLHPFCYLSIHFETKGEVLQ
jgi:hypothetical protein